MARAEGVKEEAGEMCGGQVMEGCLLFTRQSGLYLAGNKESLKSLK